MSAGHALGFDLGGQSVKAALVDGSGNLLRSGKAPTGKDTSAEALKSTLGALKAEVGADDVQAPYGLGFAGVVGDDGVLQGSPNLPLLLGEKIGELAAQGLGGPVEIDNDANCAAVAEGWGGAADGSRDFMLVTVGTGVGAGLVLDGRVFTGSTGHGCEFGHMIVVAGGRACGCGAKGCIEAYACEAAIASMVKERGGSLEAALAALSEEKGYAYAQGVFELADEGNAEASEICETVVTMLGIAMGSAVNVLDITTLVVAGGIGNAVMARKAALEKAMDEVLFARSVSDVDVVASARGPIAGAIGAARIAMLAR